MKNSPLLADVARDPHTLAEALLSMLKTQSAVLRLLQGAMDHFDVDAASGPVQSNPLRSSLASPQPDVLSQTGTHSVFEEEEASKEEMHMIKAKTMFNMIEEVDDGKCKLLFLTNPQADLIASTPESVQKMLDALEVPKPSLVIDLMLSSGFATSNRLRASDIINGDKAYAGRNPDRAPFLSREDERVAEAKIDRFMTDILIPLAAQTNAVVLCNAIPGFCILSTCFLRMYKLARAQWTGAAPFTVLSHTDDIDQFYANPDEDAHWRTVRRASKAWRSRDAKLLEVHGPKDANGHCVDLTAIDPTEGSYYDLDANAACILLTDCVNPKNDRCDPAPYSALMGALIRHLSNTVPSLAIRTGTSKKEKLGSPAASALDTVTVRMLSGTPVLALDVRPRTPILIEGATRELIIEAGKAQIDEVCEALLASEVGVSADSDTPRARDRRTRLTESLDVCTLAYLQEVLMGDGDSTSTESGASGARTTESVPLHRAIKLAGLAKGDADEDSDELKPATPEQIEEVGGVHDSRRFRGHLPPLTRAHSPSRPCDGSEDTTLRDTSSTHPPLATAARVPATRLPRLRRGSRTGSSKTRGASATTRRSSRRAARRTRTSIRGSPSRTSRSRARC